MPRSVKYTPSIVSCADDPRAQADPSPAIRENPGIKERSGITAV
jgi:hypothetical protein